MSKRVNCEHSNNSFCYVCGFYIAPKQIKHSIQSNTKFSVAYEAYFGMPIRHQDKSWAPHVSCGSCRSTLEAWYRGSQRKMPFAVPRIWREPADHVNDCYFCIVNLKAYKKPSDRKNLQYPNLKSTSAPIPHCEIRPVPIPPSTSRTTSEEFSQETTEEESEFSTNDETYRPNTEPHFLTQADLNDLVRDLGLTKEKAELLGSRLGQWNLLHQTCASSVFRKRHIQFSSFFSVEDKICYCSDISGLFNEIGLSHDPKEWRLFVDSSIRSLKAVLLHNGNELPSIPVAHSTCLKEDYNNVKILLEKIKYNKYRWDVCGDFKMLGFYLGLQGGYTKYSCFLCLWNSRADNEHYIKRDWPTRNKLIPGKENVLHQALVARDKVLLPTLHIKLGLVKQFIKALDITSEAFQYIRNMFPSVSTAKVQGGIFTGPQIRKMLKCEELENKMSPIEKSAWVAFRNIVTGFLGNNRNANYEEDIQNLLETYKTMGCRMSLKLHFLHSHLEFFRPNLGSVSEECGERFHQDIQNMERRYQGRWDEKMMGDYIWGLVRESDSVHKRKKKSSISF